MKATEARELAERAIVTNTDAAILETLAKIRMWAESGHTSMELPTSYQGAVIDQARLHEVIKGYGYTVIALHNCCCVSWRREEGEV